MKIQVISEFIKGEEVPVNTKGCDELEVNPLTDINLMSFEKRFRHIGIDKKLYRLSLKSYKELKQYLQKTSLPYLKIV